MTWYYLTGSNGLIAQEISSVQQRHNFIGINKGDNKNPNIREQWYMSYDLTIKGSLYYALCRHKVGGIIHCAAYTDVDKAESEPDKARILNVDVTKELCDVAHKLNVPFYYLSTDYVFDGTKGDYLALDTKNPLNVYGKTKSEAEDYVLKNSNALIIRTSTPFTHKQHPKKDFFRWVFDNLSQGKEIKVVIDQISNPTYIPHLATAILGCLENHYRGIMHIAGDLPLSRYDIAKAIAKECKFDQDLIIPITTEELNQPAKRPENTTLNTDAFQKAFPPGYHLPLHEGFNAFIKEMKSEQRKLKKQARVASPTPTPSNGEPSAR